MDVFLEPTLAVRQHVSLPHREFRSDDQRERYLWLSLLSDAEIIDLVNIVEVRAVPSDQTISAGFAILGLSTDVTTEQAKEAFHDLAQVWHPDRFAQGSRVRAKAEVKMIEVTHAYRLVRDYLEGTRKLSARNPEQADVGRSAEQPERTALQAASSANPTGANATRGPKESRPSSTGRLSPSNASPSRKSDSRLCLQIITTRKRPRHRRRLWRRIRSLIFGF
jgi:curved DNA-binding protein CbpA